MKPDFTMIKFIYFLKMTLNNNNILFLVKIHLRFSKLLMKIQKYLLNSGE